MDGLRPLVSFLLVLSLALSPSLLYSDRMMGIYESELSNLIQLSQTASEMSTALSSQLATSERNSQALTDQLLTRSLEVTALRQRVEETLKHLDSSQEKSDLLENQRKTLEGSLGRLEVSWGEYKSVTEGKIRSLESENKFLFYSASIILVVAAVEAGILILKR